MVVGVVADAVDDSSSVSRKKIRVVVPWRMLHQAPSSWMLGRGRVGRDTGIVADDVVDET